jgi:hypothetical protein
MDFLFLQLYIKKKYNQDISEYFNIGKQSVSDWRRAGKIPPQRLLEFMEKEGSLDPKQLIWKIY